MNVIDNMLDNKVRATTLCLALLLAEPAIAQQNPAKHGGNQDDCTLFTIENKDDNSLTQQEKIAALNQTLSDSVDRYDTCIQKMTSQQQGGAGEGTSGAGAVGGGSASADNQANQQQVTDSQDTSQNQQTQVLDSKTGSVPKDIPSADNDSVLQRQIRAAALKETDPEKKKKLWDLYRKYMKNNWAKVMDNAN